MNVSVNGTVQAHTNSTRVRRNKSLIGEIKAGSKKTNPEDPAERQLASLQNAINR